MLNSVLEYRLPITQAAEIMGVSERHTKRLLAAYRKDGAAALAHGNRGRRPHNAVPETAAAAVVKLASNGYAGANHTHFTELLREREGIDLSRPTVRRILVKAGMGSPRSRRSQQHRFRRRRMPQEGMLVQIDGSQHAWLEDRDPSWRCSSPWTTPPAWWARPFSAQEPLAAVSGVRPESAMLADVRQLAIFDQRSVAPGSRNAPKTTRLPRAPYLS